jgi:PPOX class probable F420-dependent enzyme
MRMDSDWARDRFRMARVARLATADDHGRPHLVPIVFAMDDVAIYSAVDAKPKSTTALRRLANVAMNPQVSVLVDHYEDDWTQLWWARADGTGRVLVDGAAALELLARRYPHYRATPPPGPCLAIEIERWSGWSAGPGRPDGGPGR